MDEALGTAVQQVGELTQLGVAGLCLLALIWTHLRIMPRDRDARERLALENKALYRAMMPEDQRKALEQAEATLEARKK